MGWASEIEKLGSSLRKEIIDTKAEPDLERTKDLLGQLQKHKTMPIEILTTTRIGNTLAKCVKTLKRHKRTSAHKDELDSLISVGDKLLSEWKDAVDKETTKNANI